MVRIFSGLACFAVFLLVANLLLGHALGDLGATARKYEQTRRAAHELELSQSATNQDVVTARTAKDATLLELGAMREGLRPHIWLGIMAALVTILVNCISVTYFIGTSRWCREVVEAYGLDEHLVLRSRRLKRRSFPFAFFGMLTTLVIISLGAASDPGASLASPASWVLPHFLVAWGGTCIIAAAFYFQARAIGANYELINQIIELAAELRKRSSSDVAESAEMCGTR